MEAAQESILGRVRAIWRYPIKSMLGEELLTADVTGRGLRGDRAFALVDQETGKVVSAKNPRKWPNLFSYHATYTSPPMAGLAVPPVRVTLPDGGFAVSSSPDFAPTLSRTLGRSVTLLTSPPPYALLDQPRGWVDVDVVEDVGHGRVGQRARARP